VVDSEFRLKGLITVKDIQKQIRFPHACKDELGRLRVGAAVGATVVGGAIVAALATCPEGYEPDRKTFERNAARTRIVMTEEPEEAVTGAHVVNTDVWSSMGQEEQAEQRRKAFEGYTVTTALMDRAAPDAIFLHCLPAHRGEEVEEAVLEGPRSRVWDQAENRLHVQKALLVRLVGGEEARTLRR